MKEKERFSLGFISFLQAVGLVVYCGAVAILFWKGNEWFGRVPNYLGPLLVLILFVTSALISALLTLGYPIILFWKRKQTIKAIRLVAYTAGWLIGFILLIFFMILFSKGNF